MVGPAIVADLARSDEVSELLLLDLVRERAETVAAEHGYGKARGVAANAGDAANLADAIRDCDVLVLPTTPGPAFAFDQPAPESQADFTVLSADLMAVPEDRILSTQVVMTIIGGEVVYRR